MRNFKGLDEEAIKTLSDPPTTGLLFPNLRILCCHYTRKTMPLLHLPLPSLVVLRVTFETLHTFQNDLKSFPKFSPDIRSISICIYQLRPGGMMEPGKLEPNYVCRWRNLCSVHCPEVTLDVDTLAYLSRMPVLTELSFTLSAALPACNPPLSFSNLHDLTLHSKSLDPILQLFSQTQLPAVTNLAAYIYDSFSKQELSSFLAGVSTFNADLERLQLIQMPHPLGSIFPSEVPRLGSEYLHPCMTFSNLRWMELTVRCGVDLTDSQVLMLASAWPKLEHLLINEDWGWSSRGGITPGTTFADMSVAL